MPDLRRNPQTGEVVDIETLPGYKAPAESTSGESSILSPPSAASMVGSWLGGFGGPVARGLGSVIGSSVDAVVDPLKKLLAIGPFGPVSSEGVGDTMLHAGEELAKNTALDLAKNEGINKVSAMIPGALAKTGGALTRAGVSAGKASPMAQVGVRAGAGALGHMLGVPDSLTAAGEIASMAAPPAARAGGRALTAAGEAMPNGPLQGLRNLVTKAASRFGAEPEVPEVTPADIMRENVAGAKADVENGFAHPLANELNDVPNSTLDPLMGHPIEGGNVRANDPYQPGTMKFQMPESDLPVDAAGRPTSQLLKSGVYELPEESPSSAIQTVAEEPVQSLEHPVDRLVRLSRQKVTDPLAYSNSPAWSRFANRR